MLSLSCQFVQCQLRICQLCISAAILELAGQGSPVLHSRYTAATSGALSHRAARQGQYLA